MKMTAAEAARFEELFQELYTKYGVDMTAIDALSHALAEANTCLLKSREFGFVL